MQIQIEKFKSLIKEKSGLIFKEEQNQKLEDSICELMGLKDIQDPEELYDLLKGTRSEFNRLLDLITIKETYFYREAKQIILLVKKIIPDLLIKKKRGTPIKILSAGCSNGAEPYSLGIALNEEFGVGTSHLFKIYGIDLGNQILKEAETGIYSSPAFRNFDSQLKSKYFQPVEHDNFQVRSEIKKIVEFKQVNLLVTPYPSVISEIDVIFYRNVSIYFGFKERRIIFQNLARVLKENGFLILSSTETLLHDLNILTMIELDETFLFQKKSASKRVENQTHPFTSNFSVDSLKNEFTIAPGASKIQKLENVNIQDNLLENDSSLPDQKVVLEEESNLEKRYQKALDYAKTKNYDGAIKVLEDIISTDPLEKKFHILKACILVNINSLDEANQICQKVLSINELIVEGHVLLGVISKLQSNFEGAVKHFKKSIYIKAASWFSHFSLGEIYQNLKEIDLAVREYETVLNLLDRKETEIDQPFDFFPVSFSHGDIQNLCRHHLNRLKKQS